MLRGLRAATSLRGLAPLRPMGARLFRASSPSLDALTTTPPAGGVATIDPSKFVDGESLVAHQARVRRDSPMGRTYNYAMLGGAKFIGASAGRLAIVKFLASLNPSADVLALANLEVDISNLQEGDCMTVKWRGKPVFVRARSAAEIEEAEGVEMSDLRDPQTDADRCVKPETLVVLGVCTHLGCVPITGAGEYNGWFCPCHGSHYDVSGRIRKGPAPLNLEVPPYSFPEEGKVLIG